MGNRNAVLSESGSFPFCQGQAKSILSYRLAQTINPLIFFLIYKNNSKEKAYDEKKMIEIKSQLWIRIINKKIIPTDICIFTIACFSSFSNRIFHSVLLKHNQIHENDIMDSLVRDETTGEMTEFDFVYIWLLVQKFMVFFSYSVDTLQYPRLKDLNSHHSWIVKAKMFGIFTAFMTLKKQK